jgi:hypothetical protein
VAESGGAAYTLAMTRAEAEKFARAQAREHPDRDTHRWMARGQPDGSWTVAKIRMPPGKRVDPLKTTTEAKPRPPQPDDPRTSYDRGVGGPWVG